jgi:hypothetical protein
MAIFRKFGRRRVTGEAPVRDPSKAEPDDAPTAGPPAPVWGRPSRCPRCLKRGYLDRMDHNLRIMYQHCPSCFHSWVITDEDIERGTLPE